MPAIACVFECSVCKQKEVFPMSRSIPKGGADYHVCHNANTGKEEVISHSLCRMCRMAVDEALKPRMGINSKKTLGNEFIFPSKKK